MLVIGSNKNVILFISFQYFHWSVSIVKTGLIQHVEFISSPISLKHTHVQEQTINAPYNDKLVKVL
jgi:hypothetical protein